MTKARTELYEVSYAKNVTSVKQLVRTAIQVERRGRSRSQMSADRSFVLIDIGDACWLPDVFTAENTSYENEKKTGCYYRRWELIPS